MQLRIAAYAIIVDDQDRILLSHWVRERAEAWTLPGGGMELGEQPDQCLRREILEETGYRATLDGVLGVDSKVLRQRKRITGAAYGDLHQLRIIYRASIVSGRLRDEQDGSSDAAAWFPLAELPARRARVVDIGLRMAAAAVARTDDGILA